MEWALTSAPGNLWVAARYLERLSEQLPGAEKARRSALWPEQGLEPARKSSRRAKKFTFPRKPVYASSWIFRYACVCGRDVTKRGPYFLLVGQASASLV